MFPSRMSPKVTTAPVTPSAVEAANSALRGAPSPKDGKDSRPDGAVAGAVESEWNQAVDAATD
jgi:hypothetical protein